MKLLLVHPKLGSGDPLVRSLQASGSLVLVANTLEEAKQLLLTHSLALEIAVIHREPHGLDLIPFIKSNPSLADLPYIITSSEWNEADFGRHQLTPEGANAYLRDDHCARDLRFVIEQVLGVELSKALESSAPVTPSRDSGAFSVKMEDATSVFQAASFGSENFKLEVEADDSATRVASVQEKTPEISTEGATFVLARDEISTAAPPADPVPPLEVVISEDPGLQIEHFSSSSVSELPAQEAITPEPPTLEPPGPELAPEPKLEVPESSPELGAELPYLFHPSARPRPAAPMGDAVVPGGAAHSPDTETLKKYLALREQDVAALSAQLHEARLQIRNLEADLQQSHALMEEQNYLLEGKEKKEQEFEREKALLTQGLQSEMEELRFQMKARADKARMLESQVRDAAAEMDRLRERVRNDIRKIRVREKELENRLEIIKKDSEALLMAREATILELKRKLDTAEFNLDLMQDRLGREKEGSAELREKLLRASQAVRLAGGLLDPADPDAGPSQSSGGSSERSDRKVS